MPRIMGKDFPPRQATLSPLYGKEFPMDKNHPLPRHNLAKNLKMLLSKSAMSAPELAKKAGVDRKTINNQLNGRYDPRPEQVDAVAQVFGLKGWLLLSPNLQPDKRGNGRLVQLLELYADANEEGKENILRVAEMAAGYKR